MNKEQEGQLIAWEALAREAMKLLSQEQRTQVASHARGYLRGKDAEVEAAGTRVFKQVL
ncbi:hypothetical protein [Stenotrophomonas maltophilia]|uniref:hypothetical protein n=1 Tax=Stenotrophomonas maltophilia TaxID=40324 RepID=UPI0015DF82F6|nr:hypothetical protein [Stenotrophomonas maltophilia]